MVNKKIQKQVEVFVDRIKVAFQPEMVVLFGSYVSGKTTPYSDIDILVIAKKFTRVNTFERFSQMYDLSEDLERDINAIGVTPNELRKAVYKTTLRDALETGIIIG
ncbi:hypothetical protein A3B02_02150 [Candidatus Roizmanbacteria bacterium RIFCSPLOWO2_01_FULL_42_14]|uniref:Polymerase nucleotidyl transferase domain-containing protein n=4 Tax=Candidatus Roizmaniibacteriota TaxID=1752723 RepID=A0A1F7K252_9BACT|nr:MAG: hypothetical protein A3D08_02530 [Candidatus Roizmanbacteria bacterium RIFCSPHIGHO2_02_FULL_43_11]OGK37785.1 MAG: hypothetical protein A3F32_01535 [Candidatus Roizmanbacteria bacterium RIFCSPHIGHO2_12_FULL_42_10]OGK51926.1 MAG: hypothetical protein A3B02_02150 [Candidatus Roizmanbacteria bacterium RIFCSPLOWO2_01_FULL_42_14]OGK61939.1 MAG: hypothetical protein A3I56_02320 [Candidatus Roizmanbacteria bacterium RIFCSPLOWO2_02_FULL_43_10]